MQIVIEIPEKSYTDIRRIASVQTKRQFPTLEQIIANGTPLPKEHSFIAVCDSDETLTKEVIDNLKDSVFVGDEDCSYCFEITEIIMAEGGNGNGDSN